MITFFFCLQNLITIVFLDFNAKTNVTRKPITGMHLCHGIKRVNQLNIKVRLCVFVLRIGQNIFVFQTRTVCNSDILKKSVRADFLSSVPTSYTS